MRQMRLWSARARRRRRLGLVLAGIALVLLVTAVVNVWLAVTMSEAWPLVVAGAELLSGLVVAAYAYRYLRRAWLAATALHEPAPVVPTRETLER